MPKFLIMILVVIGLSGCASITSESTQLVRVDALDETGEIVPDATCDLTNDKGVFSTETGKHTTIKKSGKDLNISCSAPQREDKAEGTAISRAGAGMFGNIIFGGAIGAVIDHNRGTAYNYPEWMLLVFGQTLVFDRTNHKSGVPMEGTDAKLENQQLKEDASATRAEQP